MIKNNNNMQFDFFAAKAVGNKRKQVIAKVSPCSSCDLYREKMYRELGFKLEDLSKK
jgi:hypothetical protein